MLGATSRVSTVAGTVLVGTGEALVPLSGRRIIPIGSTVDATNGVVKMEFETAAGPDRAAYGRFQSGDFYEGAFTIHQSRSDSLVELRLLNEEGEEGPLTARASQRRKRLRVWGKARGRFRTTGRHGAATVRGTGWVTSEREKGTYFKVTEGSVDVREFATGRTIRLRAGEDFLARPRCASRRYFRIRLRAPVGTAVRKAVVTVDGKRVKVRRGRRLTAPIDLRGLPEGTVKVRIVVVTVTGLRLIGTRTYRTCSPTPLPGSPPKL